MDTIFTHTILEPAYDKKNLRRHVKARILLAHVAHKVRESSPLHR